LQGLQHEHDTNARPRSVHLLPKPQQPTTSEEIVHILFIDDHKFDVVFFDIELPDGDGRELCRRVRNEGASRDACVIAVTGRTDLRDKDLEPFDGYLHKPISAGALEHALKFSEG
jgi:CheY-like chemotaxis protein